MLKQIITMLLLQLLSYSLMLNKPVFPLWSFSEIFADAFITVETTLPASNSAAKGQGLLQTSTYRLFKEVGESFWKINLRRIQQPTGLSSVYRVNECLTIGQCVDDSSIESVSSSKSINQRFRRKSI